MTMKTVGLIPVRLESSRLPEKAIVDICGLPMIIHVLKRCQLAKKLDDVFVVTDNEKIANLVKEYGGKVIMTGSHHQTGTDRLAEAAQNLEAEIIVNIQGDEALVDPNDIDKVVDAISDEHHFGLLVTPYKKFNSPSDIKAVLNENDEIMYLSRNDIPSNSRTPEVTMLKAYHIVPFKKEYLLQFASWPKGILEKIEFNEYLRILEKGHKIKAIRVESDAISVDTAEDLEYVRSKMPNDPYFSTYSS